MWLSSPSIEGATVPRIAVAVISAVAAASIGYYAYQNHFANRVLELPPGPGLHRRNAVRRRRHRHTASPSSSSSEAAGDENVDIDTVRPQGDAETVAEASDDWWNDDSNYPPNPRAGHNIVNLLFRVSEDNARRNGCVHRGCQCNSCGMVPIRGVRYRCANCADFDLCETCEAQGVHTRTHIFYKIRVPAPPFGPRQMQAVWYTGDPETCRKNLPRGLIQKLSRDTGFERPELEAFWEQWTFMANTEWRDDPDDLQVAMDRRTFERCLVPTGGSRHAAPNLIHDRMFSFYDSNRDGLIGFSEFLHGLSYRKRKGKLRKVFEGYDIDEDGLVDRRDFLRMFRAYYVLYKQMHKDILDGLEDQLLASTETQQLVRSRQPLSSLFGREGRVPGADPGLRSAGKEFHPDGSIDIIDDHEDVIVEDRGDTASREEILTTLFACDVDPVTPERHRDDEWRSPRLNGEETDRTYWVTLLEPPASLQDLPGLFEEAIGETEVDLDDEDSEEEQVREQIREQVRERVREREREWERERERERERADNHMTNGATDRPVTYSEARAQRVRTLRELEPKIEKRRRDMARQELHERWRRRQFYLDEEEGGLPPDDWADNDDVLVKIPEQGESSKAAEAKAPSDLSGFRFDFGSNVDEKDNPFASLRRISEQQASQNSRRRGPLGAENDAGKEILYQVTQQAFNELLDAIFKPYEDLAMRASETKGDREKYRHILDEMDSESEYLTDLKDFSAEESQEYRGKATRDKSLDELLKEAGFELMPPEMPTAEVTQDGEHQDVDGEAREPEYRDPTLPQFRPNEPTEVDNDQLTWYPVTKAIPEPDDEAAAAAAAAAVGEAEKGPSPETLRWWRRMDAAEALAKERGGWGRLNYEEFERIYKKQEHKGNRLDYLGSWIDFCIP